MNNILAKANYFLALEKNSMTDEIREAYIKHIEEYPNYFIVFSALAKTIIRQCKEEKISREEAIKLFKDEFVKLKLTDFLMSDKEVFPLIELIFKEKQEADSVTIKLLKDYIDVADKISVYSITYGIYYAVLNALLVSEFIGIDLDFSEKVINFVKEHKETNEDEINFSNIFTDTIFYI